MHAVEGASRETPMPEHQSVEITFIIRGGPPTTIDGIEGALERVLCRAVTYRVQRRLGLLVCAKHQERPRVVASGPSADHLSFSVAGCCQAFVELATAKLG
jgi:hypothetical protein